MEESPPIVVPTEKPCSPLILNEMTRSLTPNGDRSWAYKVAMLEQPESFQVIYPAYSQAEMAIREVLDSSQNSSVLISGESGLKQQLKQL